MPGLDVGEFAAELLERRRQRWLLFGELIWIVDCGPRRIEHPGSQRRRHLFECLHAGQRFLAAEDPLPLLSCRSPARTVPGAANLVRQRIRYEAPSPRSRRANSPMGGRGHRASGLTHAMGLNRNRLRSVLPDDPSRLQFRPQGEGAVRNEATTGARRASSGPEGELGRLGRPRHVRPDPPPADVPRSALPAPSGPAGEKAERTESPELGGPNPRRPRT